MLREKGRGWKEALGWGKSQEQSGCCNCNRENYSVHIYFARDVFADLYSRVLHSLLLEIVVL
jgi:hypothetical protein